MHLQPDPAVLLAAVDPRSIGVWAETGQLPEDQDRTLTLAQTLLRLGTRRDASDEVGGRESRRTPAD